MSVEWMALECKTCGTFTEHVLHKGNRPEDIKQAAKKSHVIGQASSPTYKCPYCDHAPIRASAKALLDGAPQSTDSAGMEPGDYTGEHLGRGTHQP